MIKQLSYQEFIQLISNYKLYFPYIYQQINCLPKEGLEFYSFDNNIGLLIGKEIDDDFLIYRIEINSKYRRRRYGSKFLKSLFSIKKHKRFIVCYLDETAKKFYTSLGFRDAQTSIWHQMIKL